MSLASALQPSRRRRHSTATAQPAAPPSPSPTAPAAQPRRRMPATNAAPPSGRADRYRRPPRRVSTARWPPSTRANTPTQSRLSPISSAIFRRTAAAKRRFTAWPNRTATWAAPTTRWPPTPSRCKLIPTARCASTPSCGAARSSSTRAKFADAIPPAASRRDKGDGELQEPAKYLLGRALLATQKETDGRALLQAFADAQPPGKYRRRRGPGAGRARRCAKPLSRGAARSGRRRLRWPPIRRRRRPRRRAAAGRRSQANQPDAAEKLFQTARSSMRTGDARKVANTGLLRILFQQKRYAEWVDDLRGGRRTSCSTAPGPKFFTISATPQFSLKHWPEAVAGFDQYLREFRHADQRR